MENQEEDEEEEAEEDEDEIEEIVEEDDDLPLSNRGRRGRGGRAKKKKAGLSFKVYLITGRESGQNTRIRLKLLMLLGINLTRWRRSDLMVKGRSLYYSIRHRVRRKKLLKNIWTFGFVNGSGSDQNIRVTAVGSG